MRKTVGNPIKKEGKQNSVWIWGLHPVKAALSNSLRKVEAVYCVEQMALPTKAPIHIVGLQELKQKLPSFAVHQGIAAKVQPLQGMHISSVQEGPLFAFDQITDPHNVGALWRSAAAFGFKGILMTTRHAPALEGTVSKAASGAIDCVPAIYTANFVHGLQALKKKGFICVGLCEDGDKNWAQSLSGIERSFVVFVLGAEGKGLRSLTKQHCDFFLSIPTTESFSTLNVSTAGAIAAYALLQNT